MTKLKDELASIKFKKEKPSIKKEEMIEEIMLFFYKALKANKWSAETFYENMGLKDIFELQEKDAEELESILSVMGWHFTEDGTYCGF